MADRHCLMSALRLGVGRSDLLLGLGAAALLVGCVQPIVDRSARVEPRSRPGPVRPVDGQRRPEANAERLLRLSSQPQLIGHSEQVVIEYLDQVLTGGGEAAADKALLAFQSRGMRCISSVRRQVPPRGLVQLAIQQNDPFSSTRFVLRCRGVCDGVRFNVQTGFPSDYRVQDGTAAGYPFIEIAGPRMAQKREQGITAWRGPDAPPGEAVVELLQFSSNRAVYGSGC